MLFFVSSMYFSFHKYLENLRANKLLPAVRFFQLPPTTPASAEHDRQPTQQGSSERPTLQGARGALCGAFALGRTAVQASSRKHLCELARASGSSVAQTLVAPCLWKAVQHIGMP